MEKLFYINEKMYNDAYDKRKEIDLLLNEGWTIKSITPFAQHTGSSNSQFYGSFGAYIVLENN